MRFVSAAAVAMMFSASGLFAAPAAPVLDAFGREPDVLELDQVAQIFGGSLEWAAAAYAAVLVNAEVQQQQVASKRTKATVSRAYLEKFPGKSAADFEAFFASEEGTGFVEEVQRTLLAEGGEAWMVEAAQMEAAVATTLIELWGGSYEALAEQGLEQWPPDARLLDLLRAQTLPLLARHRCAWKLTAREVGTESMVYFRDEIWALHEQKLSDPSCPVPPAATLAADFPLSLPYDAFSRPISLEKTFSLGLESAVGSGPWSNLGTQLLGRQTELWQALRGITLVSSFCSREYRRQNPAATVAEFTKFMASREKDQFLSSCKKKLLTQEDTKEVALAGQLARFAGAVIAAKAVNGVKLEMGGAAEIPKELIEEALETTSVLALIYPCAVRKAYARIGLEGLLGSDSQKEEEMLQAVEAEAESCRPPGIGRTPFGTFFDPPVRLKRQLLYTLRPGIGDEAWTRFSMGLLEIEGKLLARTFAVMELEDSCDAEYLRENPGKTQAEYLEFLGSQPEWQINCYLRRFADPDKGPAFVDAFLASMEMGLVGPRLPLIYQGVQKDAGQEPNPEIPAEWQKGLPSAFLSLFEQMHCLVEEVKRKAPIAVFAKAGLDPTELRQHFASVVSSGVCSPK